MNHLILWDIDGTLMHGGGVSAEALRAGMERAFGPLGGDAGSFAGKTDQQIIRESYPERIEADFAGALAHFTPLYLEEIEQRRELFQARALLLPGVSELLVRLHADLTVLQSVLTGNIRPAAEFKLGIFGLDRYLDLDVGAYGSDHHHRPELVSFALRRAQERYGRQFAGADVVVIGDTPNDIACGKATGARTIGVATGPFNVAELLDAGADEALADLAHTDEALRAILPHITPSYEQIK